MAGSKVKVYERPEESQDWYNIEGLPASQWEAKNLRTK